MNKWLGIAIAAVVLGGCSISHRVSLEDGEGVVPQSFFRDLKKNKTEKVWVVANLGEPQYLQHGPDQQEIYTYQLTRTFNKHGDILFFFRYNGAELETEYFHVLFQNDLVKRHWLDKYAQVQTHQGFKKTKIEEPQPEAEKNSIAEPQAVPDSGSEMPTPMQAEPTPSPEPADYYVPQGSEFRI